jgi:hypothetical protein
MVCLFVLWTKPNERYTIPTTTLIVVPTIRVGESQPTNPRS